MYRGPARRHWTAWVLGVAVAILALVVVLILLGGMGAFGGPRLRGPLFGFWGGFLLLFLFVWVAFFLVRVAFWSSRRARWAEGRDRRYGGPGPAVEIVRQRYARGEISREQFDQVMTDLTRRHPPPGS